MTRLVPVAVGSAVLLVALGQVARADHDHGDGDDMHELPVAMGTQRGASPATGVTIYLNRHGGTLSGGWDDSASDVSSVALNMGGDVTVPAWRGGDRRWKQVAGCVRERFGDFDIEVVTERPRGGDYMMVMVGGRPSILGYPESVGGVAPYTGEVLRNAVGYVFAESFEHDIENTCVGILHEAGHMLGLDHAYLCEDPMSYLWGCGEKRFQDADTYCGEGDARSCGDGETTQNSYRHLAAAVGLRDGEPEPEEPADDDPPFDRGEPVEDGVDVAAPVVSIEGGDDQLAGNQWIEIVVVARDDSGISDVELGWASESAQYVFACSAVPSDMPVACTRDGNVFRFQLYVGIGLRAMAARATDAVGNQTVSDARVVSLI